MEKRFLQVGGQSFLSLDPGGLLFVPSAPGGARFGNRLNDAGSGRLVYAADGADAPIREVEIEPSPEDDSVDSNPDDLFGRDADAFRSAGTEVDRVRRTGDF